MSKLDFIKIKNTCATTKKIQPQSGKNYLQIIYFIMDLYPQYITLKAQ